MLGCTLALYHLCRGQSVHQLLPPPYRAVWLEWLDAEQSAQQEAKEKENKPRDQFVSRLMKKLKMEDSDSGSAQQSTSLAQSAHSKAAVDDDDDNDDDETQDNWEDLADQDLHGNRQHQELLKTRRELPVFQFRQSVLDHVHKSNVVVVAGETGGQIVLQLVYFAHKVVKGILGRRPDLKVILMSATLDSGKFSAYFSHCPVLNIPGRTFPVEVKHIEDLIEMTGYVADEDSPYTLKHSQLVEDVLKHLESAPPYCEIDGAVLIFLPGLADIQELFQIFALHSVLSSEDQGRVFAVPPAGIRKIVLATNIAETGITIPDVVFVIDSGKVKENRYNERSQMSSLIEVFISKANAKQRQGRAGRVRDGFCFRLYTAEKYHKMAEFTLPEILRVPLEELCLLIMPSSVQRAMSLLYEVGACFADTRELTPLGHHLASLPVNVRIGKMLIYAAILGCLEPVVECENDLIKLVYSIGFTTHSSNKQHKTSDMPLPDVLDISKVSSKTHDLDQQTVAMVKAVLCAGLYSQVAKVTPVDSAQASAHPVSPRILSARFNSKGRKVTILQCYAPTNMADEEEKENFYEQLQAVLDKAPRRDLKILMGDLNAKVGTDNTDRELIMGKHGTGTQNENGELFTEFCTTNDLVIGGTIFPHKTIHKTTWTSPDGRTVNQIDHITIGRKWRRSLLDVRAKRGADAASDHHLVIAAIKIKLKAYRDQADRPSHKYNVHSLKESVKTNAFRCELRNRFSALDTLPEETIEEHWHDLRETWTATCREVLGKKTRQHKEWLTSDTWDLITERKRLKDLINHTDDQDHKRDLQAQYWDVNRQVKRSARNDKRNFINDLTEEAETAAGQRNMKRLYEITRTLSGKNNNPTRPVKDKNGQIITKEEDQRTRWAEHFKETLNRPPPPVPPDIPLAAQLLDISTNPPTKTEIIKAIKSLKSGKAAGPDGIPPEALKADIQTSTDMLHPLLRKIWESESVPQDWKKGHLIKLPKKGDLSSCSNWRGIMLLSIPGKVLTRIILERLKTALDKTLREEQAGFRNDRSCTDHIATMRIIIEQSLEWQTPLYSTFVDFQKAFDSVDREVIWKLMSHYGFPPKFVNIIRQLYEDATCQIIHDGKLTEPFTVRTGVRQGCILSPTIFLMVVDWVMRQATDGKRTGIQWTFSKQLEDLDFADDIALLSHKQQDAQEKLNRVAEEAEKTGLKINISKTEVMRVNHKQHDPIQLHQEDIKEVDKFIYLGSVVSKDGGTDEDIKSRTNKARHAFRTLRPIWRSTALSLRNKIRIFNSNVKSVLLYGSETWRTTKTGSHRLQTFINRCLRNILNIRYPLVITNQDLWERTRQVPIEQEIKKRKWGWIGHTLRKPTSNVTRQSLDWNPQGKRKVGRPKQTWRRSTDAEAKAAGTTWAELKRASQNRVRWRSVVAALCSPGNKED
nr:hypothetical protein BaRGS_017102 [Batillaria attramentaria]